MIVVFSHVHPSVSQGGAEVSAYSLYLGLRRLGHPAAFVAMVAEADLQRVELETEDEHVVPFLPAEYDHHFHTAPPSTLARLEALLETLQPKALVFHHFLNLGLNTLRALAAGFPGPSALVLHEYLAICGHHGQMVTFPDKRLCERSSPAACARCHPTLSPEHFHVRRILFQEALSGLHCLVSPSQFLADRFVAWGVPRERLKVIENGLRHGVAGTAAVGPAGGDGVLERRRAWGVGHTHREVELSEATPEQPRIVGYFGQINPFKGLDLVLEAVDLLERAAEALPLRIRVHGHFVGVSEAFRAGFLSACAGGGLLEYRGPYRNEEVLAHMADCDYVLMASRWWENSPVVIQEAFAAGRPLIVPGLGGMAEKVAAEVSGHHFQPGSAASLARVLRQCTQQTHRFRLPLPGGATEMARSYLAALGLGRSVPAAAPAAG